MLTGRYFFGIKGSSFLKIGVTCAIFSLFGKVSLHIIALAMLQMGRLKDGIAALTTFGGIASTPVAFFASSFLMHFETCFAVTGRKLKLSTSIFSDIFLVLGCSLFTGSAFSMPMFLALFM